MTSQKRKKKTLTRNKVTTKRPRRCKKLDTNAINVIMLKEIIDHLYVMVDRMSPKKGFAD